MSAETIYVSGQAKTIKDSAEAWKLDHLEASNVHFVERLIPVFVGLVSFVEELLRESWRSYKQSPQTYPAQAKGELLATYLDVVMSAVDGLEPCISVSEGQGYVVDGAEDARAAARRLVSLREWFRDAWPMLDAKAAEAASARIASGQYVALEDLADALDPSR